MGSGFRESGRREGARGRYRDDTGQRLSHQRVRGAGGVRAGAQPGLVHAHGPHAGLSVVGLRHGELDESTAVLSRRHPSCRRSRSPRAPRCRSSMPTAVLRLVLPLLAAFGTACFGLSYHQTFFEASALAVGGLFVAGVCYFWLVARYILLLARTQGWVCTVASIAGGLVVKLPLLLLLTSYATPDVQVAVAMVAPVASALVFEAAVVAARAGLRRRRGGAGGEGERSARPSGTRSSASRRFRVRRVRCVAGGPACHAHPARRRGRCPCRHPVGELPGHVGRHERRTYRTDQFLLFGIVVPAACVAAFAYVAARAHGRRRAHAPFPAGAPAHPRGPVRRRHPGESRRRVPGVPHRGHSDRRAVRPSAVLGRRGLRARGARPAVVPRHGVCRRRLRLRVHRLGAVVQHARPSSTRCS